MELPGTTEGARTTMSENPDDYAAPPPAPEAEPLPPLDNTWVTMDIIERSDNRPGSEHRER